jgi:hypothetical protein
LLHVASASIQRFNLHPLLPQSTCSSNHLCQTTPIVLALPFNAQSSVHTICLLPNPETTQARPGRLLSSTNKPSGSSSLHNCLCATISDPARPDPNQPFSSPLITTSPLAQHGFHISVSRSLSFHKTTPALADALQASSGRLACRPRRSSEGPPSPDRGCHQHPRLHF